MMQYNMYICFFTWIWFSLSFGIIEAKIFHDDADFDKKFKDKWKFNIHILFTFVRILWATPLILAIYVSHGIIDTVYYSIAFVLSFPFIHDGAYYQTRKILSNNTVYLKGWFDRSTTTTSIFSFDWYTRTVLFVVSLFCL